MLNNILDATGVDYDAEAEKSLPSIEEIIEAQVEAEIARTKVLCCAIIDSTSIDFCNMQSLCFDASAGIDYCSDCT